MENLDPVLPARIQFAFTVSFHILFPAFTIGLASWLAVLERRWLSTGESSYERTYRMRVKIFAGGSFDWLNAYSVMTGIALVFGYALLGATWLVMKTDGVTQEWARRSASYVLAYVGLFLVIVSISMPMMNTDVKSLRFSMPTLLYLLPMPLITIVLFVFIRRDLQGMSEYRPFFLSLLVFLMGYIGLVVSLWPWPVPFSVTFRQAAAAGPSQSLFLVGTVILLPVVLAYTGFCYYLFRGKASHEGAY